MLVAASLAEASAADTQSCSQSAAGRWEVSHSLWVGPAWAFEVEVPHHHIDLVVAAGSDEARQLRQQEALHLIVSHTCCCWNPVR